MKELEKLDRDAPPVPNVGEGCDMEVIALRAGKLSEFVKEENMDKWENAEPDDPYIEIVSISDDKVHGTTNLFSNPDVLTPYHKLTKLINAFGQPEVGKKLPYVYNSKGRWEIAGI